MISDEDIRKRLRRFYRLGWFWVLIQVLCVLYVLSTLYTISEKGTPISYGFSAIWIAFMAVVIGIYGVQVLREKLMRTQCGNRNNFRSPTNNNVRQPRSGRNDKMQQHNTYNSPAPAKANRNKHIGNGGSYSQQHRAKRKSEIRR